MRKYFLEVSNESGDRWTCGYWDKELDREQIAQFLWDNFTSDFEEVDGEIHSYVSAVQKSFEPEPEVVVKVICR